MKQLILFTCFVASSAVALAQTGKTPAKKPVAKQPTAPVLKTLKDSASYAIGMGVANFYKQQGITSVNSTLIAKGINDVYGNQTPLMSDVAANNIINKLLMQIQAQKSQPAIAACNSFLADNKKKPGIKTTASGLQYEVITEGQGIKPTTLDTFVCNYRGTLLNGTEFDASYNRGQPLTMPVNQVIRGWTEGLQLMPIGSKYKFYIPYDLAYGLYDNGPIPGGSLLIFEVELLDVKKHQP